MANLDKIRFYPRPAWEDRMVGGRFEGSNDDPEGPYTLIYQIPGPNPPPGWSEIPNMDLGTYRYLRYRSPDSGWGNVTEIEFYRNGIKVTGIGFGSLGSFENNGMTFHKALDGDLQTYFDGATYSGQFVGIDSAVPVIPVVPSGPAVADFGSSPYGLLYQIAENTAGIHPGVTDGVYALACKVLRNTGGSPTVGDSLYNIYYKIAASTAGVAPKHGDRTHSLLGKIAQNTSQGSAAGSPLVGDGMHNLLGKIGGNTAK